ncbi:hypothetical protein SAMN05444159_1243 [Bradyrhizobium lablabi]|uniref:Uncharacterized protein n=1 Tax=Bradyrhizobium lablabi TaxID=722472 RepID=A0A1M6LCY7_9BRAD|nr:hypothetical protein [Bradyrhizobium lablabi]SHJ69101.1 hypothetical protein SAMN05444159_1243 [Bradyrhizobium lablabi]
MQEHEIRAIVKATLDEEREQHGQLLDDAVIKAVASILTAFGIEDDEKKEIRADFRHLRRWRKSVEAAQGLTFKVVITALVSGFVGAVWLGFKTLLGK